MHVGVGSGNPVKRRAVETALNGGVDGSGGSDSAAESGGTGGDSGSGDLAGAIVDAVPVDSGVSEQPVGHPETVAGAEARARNVLAAAPDATDVDRFDLAVGVEGGVAEVDYAGADELFLVMWAAVTDGERWGRGSGPSLALPASVAERVRAGEELGPVMDDTLGEEGVARRGGAVGALTGGRVDREAALSTAVAGALGPFVTDLYGGR